MAQNLRENISTSTKPLNPAASTQSAYAGYVDAALAHQPPVLEHVLQGGLPVADMEGRDQAETARPGDLGLELGIPPYVVHVHGDAERRGSPTRSQRSFASRRVLMTDRSPAYMGCRGSTASRTPSALGQGKDRLDAGLHLRRASAMRTPGCGPADQDEQGRAQGRGRPYQPFVVPDALRRGSRRQGPGKKPPRTRDTAESPADRIMRARGGRVPAFERLLPDGDARYACFRVLAHRGFQVPGLGRGGVDRAAAEVVHAVPPVRIGPDVEESLRRGARVPAREIQSASSRRW